MLFQISVGVTLVGMATTLWMAFYLFARGFPNKLTLRVVVTLLALSIFFYGAYNNTFHQTPGTAAWRAALLVIGLVSWYSLTYHIMPAHSQKRLRWLKNSLYLLAIVTIGLLLLTDSFINEEGNALLVARMRINFTYLVYGVFQWGIAICMALNLLVDDHVGLTSRGKYFLVASVFPVFSVVYGVLALASPQGLPRVIPDLFIFCGVFMLGLSVARHQTLTERRTTFQDFPLTTLTVFGLTAIYATLAQDWGLPVEQMGALVGLVILTHAVYDLAREFLERLRIRTEGTFRKQLHQLEGADENELGPRVQEGLDLLCQTLNAPSGFVAIRRGELFIVTATRSTVPVGSEIAASLLDCEDVSHPKENQLPDLAWIAPSFEGHTQVAVVGIGKPQSKLDYSSGDLDLLAEVADQIGTLVSLSDRRPRSQEQIQELASESQASMNEIHSVAGGMINSMESNPDSDFVKVLEDALRHLPDVITLGESELAGKMSLDGTSQIERGKRLQQIITESIEALRPAEKRPPEPLPRVWYNHAVLYDAYVEGVPNREIMARLYISEGTFNRTRRNAIRGLARVLAEDTRQKK